MKLLKYLLVLIVAAVSFASASPADAQVRVQIGPRHPYHRRVVVVRRPYHRWHRRTVVVRHY